MATMIKGGCASKKNSALDLYLATIETNLGMLREQAARLATAVAEAKATVKALPKNVTVFPSEKRSV